MIPSRLDLCQSVPTRSLNVAAGFLALLAGLTCSAESGACTILPSLTLEGLPNNGATDVPTDVVPFYGTFAASLDPAQMTDARFVLRSPAGSELVLTPTFEHAGIMQLRTGTELLPNTRYTLEGTWTAISSQQQIVSTLEFVTGAGPVASEPSTPSAVLTGYRFGPNVLNSCFPSGAGTCVAVAADLVVEVTKDGARSLHVGSFFTADFACFELRARALNDTYSEPITLCGADAPLFELTGGFTLGCSDQGLATPDGMLSPVESVESPPADASSPGAGDPAGPGPADGGSCMLARRGAGASHSTGWVLALLSVLGLFWLRRLEATHHRP